MKGTLLSAVTATGAGSATNLLRPLKRFSVTVTWSGTAPTNTVVSLDGSEDGTNFAALSTQTITASGTIFHVDVKPVIALKGNFVSKSGGDGTTAVTITFMAVE